MECHDLYLKNILVLTTKLELLGYEQKSALIRGFWDGVGRNESVLSSSDPPTYERTQNRWILFCAACSALSHPYDSGARSGSCRSSGHTTNGILRAKNLSGD